MMGNESVGLSPSLHKHIDRELLIPDYGHKQEKSDSLNVSIATSIVLSEFRRVQNYSKWKEIEKTFDFILSITSV